MIVAVLILFEYLVRLLALTPSAGGVAKFPQLHIPRQTVGGYMELRGFCYTRLTRRLPRRVAIKPRDRMREGTGPPGQDDAVAA